MLKILCVGLFSVVLATSSASGTEYTVQVVPPFGITLEVGEFVRVFTNFGFCSSCSQQCQICPSGPGAYQWGIADSGGDCSLGEEWPDFSIGYACVAPPCTSCWYEIVGGGDESSPNCWVLEPCPE
jgi:hypothetical protein